MKHVLRWCAVLVALALALPAQAAEATKISFQQNAKLYREGSVTSWASGNPGINGDNYAADLFDENFANYVYQNTAGAYLVIDLTPICQDPDGQPFVTDILIGHAGNTKYSLYYTTEEAPAEGSTSDDRTWTPIVEQTQAGGKKTYSVNAVATAVKYVWDTSLGWGGQSLAEIEVQGYEYVPPKVLKISSLNRFTLYREGTATKGNFTLNGTSSSSELFDGNFSTTLYQNTAGAYCVLDTTVFDENDVSTGNGYYVTDILIGHAGNTKYSLYYTTEEAPATGATSDDRTWIPIIEQTQAGSTKTYGVNAIATAVKYVWDTSLGWGGTSLAEIEIWGMDPSTIACLHPNIDSVEWTVVPNSSTCTEFGKMKRVCPDCGEEFFTEDPDQLPAHDYIPTLTRAGTVAAYGEGYYECSRCGDHVDFASPDNLVTSAKFSFGPLVPGQLRFTSYTVSSVWHGEWGVKADDLFNGSWAHNYTCWTSVSLDDDEGVDLYFGAPIDLTSVDVAAHNHNHTLLFYNVDDETGTKTLIGEQVVVEASEATGDAQRFQVPLYGDTVSTHLWVTTANDSGYSIWGGRGMCIVELEPYGTIPGANKLKPTVRIGLDGYDSLAEAVAAVAEGAESTTTITLEDDLDLTGTENNVVIPVGKNATIDLNGHEIAADVDGDLLVQGALTLVDSLGGGKLHAVAPTGSRGIVRVEGGTFTLAGGAIESVPDPADPGNAGSYAVVYRANSTVNVTGGSITAGWFCLSGNGNDKTGKESAVTISGGTLLSTADYAVYFPNAGTLSITGGQISGAAGALAAKNGTVSITGGTFLSSGTGDIQPGTDGTAGLGDVAVNIVGQYGPTEATISGGSFTAQENAVVLSAGANGATLAVSGGTFSQAVPDEYCAEGFFPADNGSGTYGVEYRPVAKIGQNGYSTLANAVAAAKDGDTVELTTNVTLTARVEPNAGAGTAITIDLGGFTVAREGTGGNGSVFDVKSGSVVVTNGVIDCTQDDTAIVADGVYAITARSGAAVTLADLVVAVDSQAGACVYPFAGATVAIQSGTYSNATATAYQYHANWTGMAVNQANKNATGGSAVQLVTIYGGSFYLVDPALGDDSWADGEGTFLAPGRISVLTDGFYVVQPGWKVSFANEKGEAPATQLIALDGENDVFATEPTPAPQAEGFNFTGWFAAGAAEAFDFANTPIVADVELTAGWELALVVQPIDLDAQTFSADEVAAGAVPAGIQTDPVSGIESFVVNFHGQGGVTYTLQGSTSLNPADWKSEALVVGEPFACTADGELVTLSFPMDANAPSAMFFKIGSARTQAAGD